MASSLLSEITDALFGAGSETDDACCGVEIEDVDEGE
jgi:hypothetical protein